MRRKQPKNGPPLMIVLIDYTKSLASSSRVSVKTRKPATNQPRLKISPTDGHDFAHFVPVNCRILGQPELHPASMKQMTYRTHSHSLGPVKSSTKRGVVLVPPIHTVCAAVSLGRGKELYTASTEEPGCGEVIGAKELGRTAGCAARKEGQSGWFCCSVDRNYQTDDGLDERFCFLGIFQSYETQAKSGLHPSRTLNYFFSDVKTPNLG